MEEDYEIKVVESDHVLVHVKLLPLMRYVNKGDIGFVEFRRGEAFLVGFIRRGSGQVSLDDF